MTWQRGARWAFAAVGVGTAMAIYWSTRERPVSVRPPPPVASDPAATSESAAGVDTRYVLDVERWRLEYGAQRVYSDDRVQWDAVHLVFADGTEVRAEHAEAEGLAGRDGRPAYLTARGNVRLVTSEGARVAGESFRYREDTEVTEVPGPVTFERGRLSGNGLGAVYERRTGVFRLLEEAHLRTAGDDDGRAPIDATADGLVFNRAVRAALLDGGARITQGDDVMTGDSATLYLDESEERFRVIELRGQAHVMPAPGDGTGAVPPEMQAQDIDLAFHDGTQILERAVLSGNARLVDDGGRRSIAGRVVTLGMASDGTTVTHLEAVDRVVVELPAAEGGVPGRRIEAASLIATGSEARGGLTDAAFTGNVRYTEVGDADRSATARSLALKLGGQLDDIEEAVFQEDVVFRDGAVEGQADFGTYVVGAGGSLTLVPASAGSARTPLVTDGEKRVEAAQRIEVDLTSHDLHAVGDVRTVSTREPATDGAETSVVFGGGEPIYGFAEEFWYEREAGSVRYQGLPDARARLQQGERVVRADRLTLDEGTQDLRAVGHVESTLPLEDDDETAQPGRYTATAATMDYADGARTITYLGTPAEVETPEGRLLAGRVVLTLGDDGSMQAFEATADPARPETALVRAVLTEGQTSRSETLTYDKATNRYTLRGRPFVVRTRDTDGTCSESRGASGQFAPGETVDVPPGEANPGGVWTSRVASCEGPLTP